MARRLTAEPVLAAGARLGESPVWDCAGGLLDWVDAARGELHRFDPRSGADVVLFAGDPIGSFAPRRNGGHLLASGRALWHLDPGAPAPERLATLPDDVAGVCNDGKCDALGRFWVGTSTGDHGPPDGALLRLDADLSLHVLLRGVVVSNGLDWDPESRHMYYVDSFAFGLDRLTLSPTGAIETRRRVADVANDSAAPFGFTVPDGLCLDTEGCAWVAIHGLGEVHRYTPSGNLDTVISLPTLGPTSCAFGGDDLGDLYVTSGAVLPPDHARAHRLDGALFVCRPGVQGRPMHAFAG